MKQFLAVVVFAVLSALVVPAHAGVSLHRNDCENVGSYFATNAQTFVTIGRLVVPFVEGNGVHLLGQSIGVTDTAMPWTTGNASSPGWVGVSGGLAWLFGAFGASPTGIVNPILHLFCAELSETP